MNAILRAKASIQVFNEAYEDKYKGRIKFECTEIKKEEVVTNLLITLRATMNEKRVLESNFTVSVAELEKDKGNIFSTILLKANHSMREQIVMDALGLGWENGIQKVL